MITSRRASARRRRPQGRPAATCRHGGSGLGDLRTATAGARFRRLARRFGKGNEKKAAVAVAQTLLCIAWAAMRYDAGYIDAGTNYYERRDQRNREHLVRYHQNALARLGIQVI